MNQDPAQLYQIEPEDPANPWSHHGGLVLVHALEGFLDAGQAPKLAAAHLVESLPATMLATFDIDVLLDYRSRRPPLKFAKNSFAHYEEPTLRLYGLTDSNGTPFLLLSGLEPDLMWERFVAAVEEVARHFGVTRSIGLSALSMTVPHTRPPIVMAHSLDPVLIADHRKYDGEALISGSAAALLELRLAQHGIPSLGFTAYVPHYLTNAGYPASALGLLEQVTQNSGLVFPLDALHEAVKTTHGQIDEQVSASDEVQRAITSLEDQYDGYSQSAEDELPPLSDLEELPSAEELGAQFERFLATRPESAPGEDDD
ncbi:MAG: PAC2 family protein [Segniliparus sp.]|uniref:PAC2 family protein n=1 Tax=Segniliparus sp. TaxID=2804064 RepID=UPI003F3208B8